MKYIMMFGNYP